MKKGQFMIISAVIAGLLVITLSTAITEVQNHEYNRDNLPEHINQIRDEADRIADGGITQKEKRNFRKMLSYLEEYRTTAEFESDCVRVTLQNTERKIEMPCMS